MDEEKNSESTSDEKKKMNPSTKSFFHIDWVMMRFKVHYFLFEGGLALVNPFIPVIAKTKLGLSASSMAVVLAAHQLVTVASKPLTGYIADYFNKLKLMIITLLVIQTICFFLILAIPPLKKPSTLSEQSTPFNCVKVYQMSIFWVSNQQRYKNFSVENISTNALSTEESSWKIGNGNVSNALCIFRNKSTEMLCSMNRKSSIVSTFEKDFNFSCTIMSSLPINLTEATQSHQEKDYFRLLLSDLQFNDFNLPQTFPCSFLISADFIHDLFEVQYLSDYDTLEFWMFAVLNVIIGVCLNSIFSLSDTACFESIEKQGGQFGRQRLLGSVGWGVTAVIGGFLSDITNGYLASWLLMAVLQLILLWNVLKLNLIKTKFSHNLLKDIGKVMKSIEFTTFEFGVFCNGLGSGILWFYLLWFLTSLGASKFLCGLTVYVQSFLGEIPFMFFSDWFIEKLGHFNLISISLLSYASRFLWYSYLQNPWLVLPAEIAHGFTYGTLFPAVASYGILKAKSGTEATTQSILFMLHGGLGAGVGCIIAGIGFDVVGGHQTFFYFSLMCFTAAILNIVNTIYFKYRNTKILNLNCKL